MRRWLLGVGVLAAGMSLPVRADDPHPPVLFAPASECVACHDGLVTPDGEDVSLHADWRASMMANAALDPYWFAAVRREILDHPDAQVTIEDECSRCHAPAASETAHAMGAPGQVFALADPAWHTTDGVTCTVCHQITPDGLGIEESFTGGFVIDRTTPLGEREVYGPYEVDGGLSRVMHSATGFVPAESTHVQRSALCATCHTLYTHPLGPDGEVLGEFPEQVPYLEWQHSAYREQQSCQDCHMPVTGAPTPIASVLGEPREGLSRHTFTGGNFFMLRMLGVHRDALGVEATARELDRAAERTEAFLASEAARIDVRCCAGDGEAVEAEVIVRNLSGHKLPTGYPSRRAWIRFTVTDSHGEVLFSSGELEPSGRLPDDDHDDDPRRFEPHHERITRPDQVQVYASVMEDAQGLVTTGLLSGVRYAKDNRLLPDGFDVDTAPDDIAVWGRARDDADFVGGSDRVVYAFSPTSGPLTVRAELWFQPIAWRWAQQVGSYDAFETRRFLGWFDALSHRSAARLATSEVTWSPPQRYQERVP